MGAECEDACCQEGLPDCKGVGSWAVGASSTQLRVSLLPWALFDEGAVSACAAQQAGSLSGHRPTMAHSKSALAPVLVLISALDLAHRLEPANPNFRACNMRDGLGWAQIMIPTTKPRNQEPSTMHAEPSAGGGGHRCHHLLFSKERAPALKLLAGRHQNVHAKRP